MHADLCLSLATALALLVTSACGVREECDAPTSPPLPSEVPRAIKPFVGCWLSDGPDRNERAGVLLLSSHGQARVNRSIMSKCGIGSWAKVSTDEITVTLTEACGPDSFLPNRTRLRFVRRLDGRLAESGTEPGEVLRLWHRWSCEEPKTREFVAGSD